MTIDLLFFAIPLAVCAGGLTLSLMAARQHWIAGGKKWFW